MCAVPGPDRQTIRRKNRTPNKPETVIGLVRAAEKTVTRETWRKYCQKVKRLEEELKGPNALILHDSLRRISVSVADNEDSDDESENSP